jgi:hypothetical protein
MKPFSNSASRALLEKVRVQSASHSINASLFTEPEIDYRFQKWKQLDHTLSHMKPVNISPFFKNHFNNPRIYA